MTSVNIIFPHQLFENNPLLENTFAVYLVEEHLFFNHYKFHKQKIAYHRASMKVYEAYLKEKNVTVHYIDSQNPLCDIRRLVKELHEKEFTTIHCIDPVDDWLEKRITSAANTTNIKIIMHPTLLFLNGRDELKNYFTAEKTTFFQTEFYIAERKKRKILIDKNENPAGGKWTYDIDNRKKYPAKKIPPQITYPATDLFYKEANTYTEKYFKNNLGNLSAFPQHPFDHASAKKWLNDFLLQRFEEFGPYEDAIVAQEKILHHSKLTPMLNTGLLTPAEVITAVIQFSETKKIPLNSVEGFIRQIIGWREFMHGVYECKGVEERTRNFWKFTRKISASFYDGTTGIMPVDYTIKKVLDNAYCHHIERLMILGNFMLLCEFDPDDVYKWFMELFIDAYDWVMVPNVYGMSQFADGGLVATKPYISGSNYIIKMSNYKKGEWQQIWDALFWRFMYVHRSFFETNPRLGMLLKNFDAMPKEKRQLLLLTANSFLASLS